ncbi:hypothetical protein [Aeromonas dhakensis]|uniref:hypothetical protein n=1 Tax=Aeromonas dhakensis TaxID=196024 RepID=UPI0029DA4DB3|nr:hypothetical protein [Aeromonas dhakensis]MDX7830316.1 hypothetical protein [Aeromonas dhakensis]
MDYVLIGTVILLVGASVVSIKRHINRCIEMVMTNQRLVEKNLIGENEKLKEQIDMQTEELFIMMRYVKIYKGMEGYRDFREHLKNAMFINGTDIYGDKKSY